MKSVGLMTMHRICNCGSCLQTYATFKIVERLGYECTAIDYLYPTYFHISRAKGDENAIGSRFQLLKKLLRVFGLLMVVKTYLAWRSRNKAIKGLLGFSSIRITKPYTRHSILKNPPSFDIYLTGSDQTWNPRYMADDYSFLLDFTPDSARRIAYAASFGCSQLPAKFLPTYSKLIQRYDAISVRETSGVDIVDLLTGMKALDVVDPTFLLSAEDWRRAEHSIYAPRERFIFAYLLSYVFDPYPYAVDLLVELSQRMCAKVVVFAEGAKAHLLKNHGFIVYEKSKHVLKPEEFLELIDKSIFVVTTSFHGTAFAVNFRKDFYAILNPNVSNDDRVKSFLEKVNLTSRGMMPSCTLANLPPLNTDYSSAELRIAELKERSLAFLSKALSGDRT